MSQPGVAVVAVMTLDLDDWGQFSSSAAWVRDMRAGGSPPGRAYQEVSSGFLGMVRLSGPRGARTLFVHGGVSVNWLDKYSESKDLTGDALVAAVNEHFRSAVRTHWGADTLLEDDESPIMSRGLVQKDDGAYLPLTQCSPDVTNLLERFDVDRIVLGHTPQADHMFRSRCDERIIIADVAMSRWINRQYVPRGYPAAMILTLPPTDYERAGRVVETYPFTPYTFRDGEFVERSVRELPIATDDPSSPCLQVDLDEINYIMKNEARFLQHDELVHTLRGGSFPSPTCTTLLVPEVACAYEPGDSCGEIKALRNAVVAWIGLVEDAKFGPCGNELDYNSLANLNGDALDDFEEGTNILNRVARQVSPACGQCLVEWERLGYCAGLATEAECDRLNIFPGIVHCLSGGPIEGESSSDNEDASGESGIGTVVAHASP